jgi:hypothetical protein
MNIKLGEPYEAAIKSIIEKGYAGSQMRSYVRPSLPIFDLAVGLLMIEEKELALGIKRSS